MIIGEKVHQALGILEEESVDLWLTFVRESSSGGDPALSLLFGSDLTWQSALMLTRDGKRIAILGSYEADTAERLQAYETIIPYDKGIRRHLVDTLNSLNPKSIAINYSKNDVLADGLSYGLYQVLISYLDGTPFAQRLVSAESILGKLRTRKTPTEIKRIETAIRTTLEIFEATFKAIRPGMTEIQVSDFMHQQLKARELEPAWDIQHCPIVDSGPESPVGHAGPTEIVLEPGHLLHIDFGVRQDGYCADLQRLAYLRKDGESGPPVEILNAFHTVQTAITEAVDAMKPGIKGVKIDEIARRTITSAGYPDFPHATGHHLGQLAHDGGGLLGPKWEKYGELPDRLLEPGHVYTVEPSVHLPGAGIIALEEDVLVTEEGSRFLSPPQTEIILL